MPALSRPRSPGDDNPLEKLLETERRLLDELRDIRVARELRDSTLATTRRELDERLEALTSSLTSLPENVGGGDEQTVNALSTAVHSIRSDLKTYGMIIGGALAFAVLLLIITIMNMGR